MLKKILFILLCISSCIQSSYAVQASDSYFDKLMKQETFKISLGKHDLKEMKKASTLVISCVDFRLRDGTEKFLADELRLIDDYDEISVPGASLAVIQTQYPSWNETVRTSAKILETLHGIKRIILLDHMDCGAYKLLRQESYKPGEEKADHHRVLLEAKAYLQTQFPEMSIYTMLLNLDGTIDNFHN